MDNEDPLAGSSMDMDFAEKFARDWEDRWNTHDLDLILEHYADDVVFHSPVAARLLGGDGRVVGKAALREYWAKGLEFLPELHFAVEGVYLGLDTIVINYRNERGNLVNEILTFKDGKIVFGHGTYARAT
ncbi:nuclear transport factor 2 family protein [Allokutzneria sp. NRRL B-24872]|uniref:nuclear transport factor 2 family protein n=1 Tax=Allokutzneria sp. NRRL B-24872 TaxID=1137961 RepID=UPI001FF00A0F|nr:nuclear transport factor 2 family protein [Allokutzneria sp. NRRL B-24872]